MLNGLNSLLDQIVFQDHFNLHLGQKIHHVFRAAIKFRVAFLAAETLGFGHGDSLDANFVESFFNLIQLKRLDDCFDFFHGLILVP